MPYTNKSLVFVWLIACALFVIVGSGTVSGTWLLVLVLAALTAPAALLRTRKPAPVVAVAPKRRV